MLSVIADVLKELEKVKCENPGTYNSRHEAFAVLLEEVDELWDEIKNNGSGEDIRFEAMQVAAVAIRFMVECH